MARWGRPLVVLAAGVAVILVAMAAAGDPLRVVSQRRAAAELPDWLLLVPLAGVALAAVGIVTLLRDGRRPRPPARRRSILPTLAVIAFAVLLASLVGRSSDENGDPTESAGVADQVARADTEPARGTSWPTWMVVAMAGAVLGAGALTRLGGPGRAVADQRAEPAPDRLGATAAATTIAASAGDLSAAEDPRAGVIAAYARLLDGLGDVGLARRVDEAPFEHVARALRRLGVRREPVEGLAVLFAEARFSTHPISEQHRAEALGCLRAALDDLRSVPCA